MLDSQDRCTFKSAYPSFHKVTLRPPPSTVLKYLRSFEGFTASQHMQPVLKLMRLPITSLLSLLFLPKVMSMWLMTPFCSGSSVFQTWIYFKIGGTLSLQIRALLAMTRDFW